MAGMPVAGSVFDGKYRVISRIAEGGMGAVYVAEHLRIPGRYALKIMLPEFAAGEGFKGRFLREIQVARALVHPNIVMIRDCDITQDRMCYYTMDLSPGDPLGKAFPAPVEWRRALGIMRQLVDALGAAHRAGVVHRDVKPANILIERDPSGRDFVKVLDFGIAKIVTPGAHDPNLTGQRVIGTPAYLAPEQALGRPVDVRADLYSACAVLHKLLTGATPFPGPTSVNYLSQHVRNAPPPIRSVRPDGGFPEDLERFVLRGLEKKPEDRWPSADSMIAEIDRIVGGDGAAGADSTRRSARDGGAEARTPASSPPAAGGARSPSSPSMQTVGPGTREAAAPRPETATPPSRERPSRPSVPVGEAPLMSRVFEVPVFEDGPVPPVRPAPEPRAPPSMDPTGSRASTPPGFRSGPTPRDARSPSFEVRAGPPPAAPATRSASPPDDPFADFAEVTPGGGSGGFRSPAAVAPEISSAPRIPEPPAADPPPRPRLVEDPFAGPPITIGSPIRGRDAGSSVAAYRTGGGHASQAGRAPLPVDDPFASPAEPVPTTHRAPEREGPRRTPRRAIAPSPPDAAEQSDGGGSKPFVLVFDAKPVRWSRLVAIVLAAALAGAAGVAVLGKFFTGETNRTGASAPPSAIQDPSAQPPAVSEAPPPSPQDEAEARAAEAFRATKLADRARSLAQSYLAAYPEGVHVLDASDRIRHAEAFASAIARARAAQAVHDRAALLRATEEARRHFPDDPQVRELENAR